MNENAANIFGIRGILFLDWLPRDCSVHYKNYRGTAFPGMWDESDAAGFRALAR
ncbi:hypothetical protein CCP4SC76_2580008 [Gammaproteobacteria bacterium]